jgi:hypothetical protein
MMPVELTVCSVGRYRCRLGGAAPVRRLHS